jgi:hypothetical protein
VSILFVFSALALASVAFLVFNLGEMTSRRIRLQNGADAAAHAAATWTARGLNLVSANNVATTQLIAMVVLIDSLDVYCDLAPDIARVQEQACLRLKWANWPPLVFDAHRDHQRSLREAAFLQVLREIVDAMVAAFRPTDPDAPDGLWQMMYMLEEFSDAVVEAAPSITQERAVALGKAHGAVGAFAWPYWTPLPVVKGVWDDFRLPTDRGSICPGPVRPKYGYHDVMGYYYNEGPLRWLRRAASMMLWTAGGGYYNVQCLGAATNFVSLTAISNLKFRLLFNNQNTATFRYREQFDGWPPPSGAEDTRWWDEDLHSIQPLPGLIIQPSNYPAYANVPDNYVPPTLDWHLVGGSVGRQTQAVGWTPPAPLYAPVPGAPLTWEDFRPFQETFYPELGVGQWGPGGVPIPASSPATIYHQRRRIFSHSTRAATLTFDNPIYRRPNLPRPFHLDPSWDQMTDQQMADQWSWLGFAWRSGESRVWPQWFVNPVPGDQMVAVARARLYNPTSWDLFTQDWRVTMVPVGPMTAWLRGLAGRPDPTLLGGLLADQDVVPVEEFFRAVPDDLHDALVTH